MNCDVVQPASHSDSVGIGLLGCGELGTAVARLLDDQDRAAVRVVGAAVRDLAVRRPALPPTTRLTRDPLVVVHDPRVHIVIDVSGDRVMARTALRRALAAGKAAITSNAELLGDVSELRSVGGAALFVSAAEARGAATAEAAGLVIAVIRRAVDVRRRREAVLL